MLNTGSADGTHWIPAECDVSIRPGWFYHAAEDSLVKSPERLFDIYLTSVGRGSTLLLNIPPDTRGLFHEKDAEALKVFKQLLDKELGNNLALHAKVTAGNYRGNAKEYAPSNLADGNKETYWATDDDITAVSFEIHLKKPSLIKYIMLQEYIQLGQRVKSFTVEVWKDKRWQQVASATTIGYKRILKVEPVTAGWVRINILDAKAPPVLCSLALY